MKKINNFVYGTQYYRAPTPLPDEWEYDMKEMEKAGLDTIQLRVQWRNNEPAEGKYFFDDTDRLFELAQKHDKKIIFKFLMENAPDYVFHKYRGTREDMHGNPLPPGGHGAFYVGGWLPCFDNPEVISKSIEFVNVFANRYKNAENLILWNIWNEPRSRPIQECGCDHSRHAYRKWLKNEFKDIDSLNSKFGKKWESFETIDPPGLPQDYAELYLWRLWAMDAVNARLKFMYDTVKKIDQSRPVISHVGACSVIQDAAGDSSDDFTNAKSMDFYGTSLPTAPHFNNIMDESYPFMICDWLRSVSEYYWVYELYPDWGNWSRKISVDDYKLKVFASLACGAKGILYWQYRAERLGSENNLAGLVNIDGSFKEISYESGKIKQFISENEDFLKKAKATHEGIGILYSLKSDLINRVENTGRDRFNFDLSSGFPYEYKKSIHGIYSLFRELGYSTKFVDSRNLSDSLQDLRLLYVPEAFILEDSEIQKIIEFSRKGGIVIAEEGIGLRKSNTWLNYPWPAKSFRELFGAEIIQRTSAGRAEKEYFLKDGLKILSGEYVSYLKNTDSETLASWESGAAAIVKRENSILLGTSLGSSFHDNYNENYDAAFKLMESILSIFNISPERERLPRGVYLRELTVGDNKMIIAFNRSDNAIKIELDGKAIELSPKQIMAIK